MAIYKHKETGEEITVSRLRIYVHDDGTTRESDANNTNIDLTNDYELVKDEDDVKGFSGVRAKANPRDSRKLR